MAGSDDLNDLPEEVPEEFADAYREAYLRALREEGLQPGEAVAPEPVEPVPADAPVEPVPDEPVEAPEVAPAVAAGRHRVTEYRSATPLERVRGGRWFLPLLVALVVLLLVLGAWALAKGLGGDDATPGRQGAPSGSSGTPDQEPSESPDEPAPTADDEPAPYEGEVVDVPVGAVAATCTMDPGVDAAGRRVGYAAANAADDDPGTAWRCDGDAIGERLVLRIPEGTRVAALGLVPGYAKTDPASGEDRYAENNRITRVRWTLASGESYVQRLDPDPESRALQLLRIPVSETGRIVLRILAVEEGERGATAISEIRVAAPR